MAGPLQDNVPINAHLWTLILSELQTPNDLFVNEVRADLVLFAVMPGREDLLAEIEPPGGVLFLAPFLLYLLLTLGDGVHQVLPAAAQSPHLQERPTFTVMNAQTY